MSINLVKTNGLKNKSSTNYLNKKKIDCSTHNMLHISCLQLERENEKPKILESPLNSTDFIVTVLISSAFT